MADWLRGRAIEVLVLLVLVVVIARVWMVVTAPHPPGILTLIAGA